MGKIILLWFLAKCVNSDHSCYAIVPTPSGKYELVSLTYVPSKCTEKITSVAECNQTLNTIQDADFDCLDHPDDTLKLPSGGQPNITIVQGTNGTMCYAEYFPQSSPYTNCILKPGPNLPVCASQNGSHSQTFLTYTILRLVTQGIGINSGFALFDAISLEYAKLHGGQYSMIFFSKSIVEPIVTALSGFLVVHSSDKNGKQVSSFLISERLYCN